MNVKMRNFIDILNETPTFGEMTGRDGLSYRIWQNPNSIMFSNALNKALNPTLAGLRGLLAETDLYVWQSSNILHSDFEKYQNIFGMKLGLRTGIIQVNDETVDQPEQFPWIFTDTDMDIEERRNLVEKYLKTNKRIAVIYPQSFKVVWYS
jgi:hypothetical protein